MKTETFSNAKFVELLDNKDIKDSIEALKETSGTSLEDFKGELGHCVKKGLKQ